MKFKLVHMYEDFNQDHFKESLVWGSYYEPDDIDEIVELGFNRSIVTNEMEKVNWSDSYYFPIPKETKIGTFMHELRQAVFTTNNGLVFEGYVVNSGHSICLFGFEKEWSININLLNRLQNNIRELKLDLGLNVNEDLFPLKVKIPYISHEFIFNKKS